MANILAGEAVTLAPDDFCVEFKPFNRHCYGVQTFKSIKFLLISTFKDDKKCLIENEKIKGV